MKLKKCLRCKEYSLKEKCPKCENGTSEAHYKFIKIKTQETKSKFSD